MWHLLCGKRAMRLRLLILPSSAARMASSSSSGSSGSSSGGPSVDFGFRNVPWSDKQPLVSAVFNSVASSYDVMNDLMSGGMHRLWKDRLVETLRPFPGMKHLDVAGGTGDVAFRVLRAIRQAELEARQASSGDSAAPFGRPPSRGTEATSSSPSQDRSPKPQKDGSPADHLGFSSPVDPSSSAPSPGGPSPKASGRRSPGAPTGSVVVCDINPQMLAEGRKKAQQAPDLAGDPGLSFSEGNAESLTGLPDSAFDAYTIAFGIRNVTDRDAALREAHRLLKPGGRFLCLEFSHVKQPGLKELYDLYSFNIIPRIGGLVANDAASYQYLVESIRTFPEQEEFAAMIKRAGFKAVTYEDLMGGIVAIHSGFKL